SLDTILHSSGPMLCPPTCLFAGRNSSHDAPALSAAASRCWASAAPDEATAATSTKEAKLAERAIVQSCRLSLLSGPFVPWTDMTTQGPSVPDVKAGITIAGARRTLASAFAAAALDSPELDARLLVGHALGLD